MRVISGSHGGRVFVSPGSFKTHPMSDKMRGALFAVLGDIKGLTVLDAFAGSGALSYEAVSRGARSAVAIDSDREAQDTIAKNVISLGLGERVELISANTSSWSKSNPDKMFDLILCDPPYKPYERLPFVLLERLPKHLSTGGTYVLSWPTSQPILELPGLTTVSNKTYGDGQLVFYKQTG